MNNSLTIRLFDFLKSWQRDQQGAVALLMLASILITFMLALVVHDVGFMAEDKLEVQIAADTASWSQSAVEARAMNIIAFANVGKRVTVGMVSYYEGLWIGLAILTGILVVAALACWAAASVPFMQWLIPWCIRISGSALELVLLVIDELPDLIDGLGNDLMSLDDGYFIKDVEGFTKYQQYLTDVTPFWSWGENFVRGFRNGAITSGWPVPSGGGGSGVTDALPVVTNDEINKDVAYESMCKRIYGGSSSDASSGQNGGNTGGQWVTDTVAHFVDYNLKTLLMGDTDNVVSRTFATSLTSGRDRIIALGAMGLMNFGFVRAGCTWSIRENGGLLSDLNKIPGNPVRFPEPFGKKGWPFIIKDDDNGLGGQRGWLKASSNLTIAYRRGINRGDAKYDMFTDDGLILTVAEQLQGVWALSRSEITYQNASNGNSVAPDLWHSSWTARMRPVALPGEWGSDKISDAYRDVTPWMLRGLAVDAVIGQGVGIDSLVDGIRMGLGTMEMNDNMDGVAK